MRSEKRTPKLRDPVRGGAGHLAKLIGTQGKHEVLKAVQEATVVQIHPVARVSPWPAASALGFPFLKTEAQAGCAGAGDTPPRGRGWG